MTPAAVASPIAIPLADAAARAQIRAERARNLLVIAGAGTGKTASIIDRVRAFLDPESTGAASPAPVPLERLAVITFTRRAAGELRFRLREELLQAVAGAGAGQAERRARLEAALLALDSAAITTFHSFADRLLKLRPIEAQLSPAYTLVEDPAELVAEAFRRLRRGAETGTLEAELFGSTAPRAAGPSFQLTSGLVAEAADTLRDLTRGGLQIERRENLYGPVPSLEEIATRMIESRDVRVRLPAVPDPGLDQARAAISELAKIEQRIKAPGRGPHHVRMMVRKLQRVLGVSDPTTGFRLIKDALFNRRLFKGKDFAQSDDVPWWIYQVLCEGKREKGVLPPNLGERLRLPYRWMAARIVRLAPVVIAMYERVKEEHEVVDYLDLLIKLRDLLRRDPALRTFYQSLFDHLFVDEFQDTDPLQCEVLFYLCEDGAAAEHWDEVRLAPGKLTLVGDPKQSIYRFRRADLTTYARAADLMREQGALGLTLTTNFRSRPELVSYFNDRLAALELGGEGLSPAPAIPPAGAPAVHVVPYAGPNGAELTVDAGGREIEAAALARYLRWLLRSELMVRDVASGLPRALRPGDVAILAPRTTQLHPLLAELDRHSIEHSIRGGTLLLSQPIVRRYLLALRSLSDPDDGAAEAALLAPPFFALDPIDLAVARYAPLPPAANPNDSAESPPPAPPPDLVPGLSHPERALRLARVEAARECVRGLRYARIERDPGATARELIEKTGLGSAVLAGANGRQTLAALYHIAFELEQRAAAAGLDFDAASALLREWVDEPVFLDLPEPLGEDAVRVMTIHQAKGLEFPVVIVWDGFQQIADQTSSTWLVDRDGGAWSLSLRPVSIEEPPDAELIVRDKEESQAERTRLYYVAATRARDLLVLPLPPTKGKGPYATTVLAGGPSELKRVFDLYRPDAEPEWATAPERKAMAASSVQEADLEGLRAQFEAALAQARVPRAIPRAVTDLARELALAEREPEPSTGDASATEVLAGLVGDSEVEGDVTEAEGMRAAKAERSRFGRGFGIAVHRALELTLGQPPLPPEESVQVALAETLLALPRSERGDLELLADHVRADVERGLGALRDAGLAGLTLVPEVDLTAPAGEATLLRGSIDLLAIGEDQVHIIDWKTDRPLSGNLDTVYPAYAAQLRLYVQALRASELLAVGQSIRAGLLLTATGELRWLDADA
jgi:ATP-dependent helicase/nuclease subunit A